MPKYLVDMEASAAVGFTVEVEANSPEMAAAKANELYHGHTGPLGYVTEELFDVSQETLDAYVERSGFLIRRAVVALDENGFEAVNTDLAIPDVHANDRDIPAGKVLTAEPGQVPDDEPHERIEVLDTKTRCTTEFKLVAKHAGWAIAGSMMRWDNGAFGVMFHLDGARHARWYRTYEEAKEVFDNIETK